MKFIFANPMLTKPTQDTVEKYAKKKFKKIVKVLPQGRDLENEVRVSTHKEGDQFVVTFEVFSNSRFLVKAKDRDLRRAIDFATDDLRTQIVNFKDKLKDRKRNSNFGVMDEDLLDYQY
jgi:ribosome-associated translation inhibitor RaiA